VPVRGLHAVVLTDGSHHWHTFIELMVPFV
jgi:hypothetical protein